MSEVGRGGADEPAVTMLAGGFGGAKLSHGMALASAARDRAGQAPLRLSVIVNVGDDLELHGLHVSPDLDTVMYTLAGLANDESGWGVRDETWSSAEMLERYGADTWFRLGDRDIATHVRRTEALRSGRRLTQVTADLAGRLDVPTAILPATDEPVRTQIRSGDEWLEFQDYFVRRGQRDRVDEVRFQGIEAATATPEALEAIAAATLIVFAPSNPIVSVGTILATPGITEALREASAPVVAVSPIVGGKTLRGPAADMLESLGGEASARGFVRFYADRHPGLVDAFILDTVDGSAAAALRAEGTEITVLDTVMREHADRERLARQILGAYLPT
jgi:LPPG:FO 2-phospho-L-lactate transferase